LKFWSIANSTVDDYQWCVLAGGRLAGPTWTFFGAAPTDIPVRGPFPAGPMRIRPELVPGEWPSPPAVRLADSGARCRWQRPPAPGPRPEIGAKKLQGARGPFHLPQGLAEIAALDPTAFDAEITRPPWFRSGAGRLKPPGSGTAIEARRSAHNSRALRFPVPRVITSGRRASCPHPEFNKWLRCPGVADPLRQAGSVDFNAEARSMRGPSVGAAGPHRQRRNRPPEPCDRGP